MLDHKLKSGAVLGLQLADFEDSTTLLDEILLASIGVPLTGFSLDESFKPADLFQKDIGALKDLIFKVISSKRVKEALWKCMASCTYQPVGESAGSAINRSTFQSAEARADYFPVAGEVASFNLAPFFKNLALPSSMLAPPKDKVAGDQKSSAG